MEEYEPQYRSVVDQQLEEQVADSGAGSLEHDPSSLNETFTEMPQEHSFPAVHDDAISPTAASLHPLPPKPQGTQSSSSASVPSIPPTTAQSRPRMKGGFEMDDDADEDEEERDDQDSVAVYEPDDGRAETYMLDQDMYVAEDDAATPAQHDAIDSTSKTPIQPNGLAHIPAHTNGVNLEAPGSVLSPNATNNALSPQRASTATPMQTTTGSATDVAPASLLVNTSNASNAPFASAVPKGRLAHDVVGILEDRIKEDPRGDVLAWLELIDELKRRNKQDEVRRLYDRYFEVFPLAAEQWCDYIKWEEEGDRKREMELLFQRSLLEVPDVQLWSIYINYIRRRHSMQTGDVAKNYKIIYDSFSFALKNVGMDKDSGTLWQDYINFIKTGPGVIGGTGWQDTQKMDMLRTAYQKTISIPTSALNILWKEYNDFETGLSKLNARKFLQERSPAYMTARSCYTQLQNLTKNLVRTTRPKLPPASGYEGDAEYLVQVETWKQWIQWEKEDNLVLKDEDIEAYRNRILFTYKQALMALQFWPEIPYDAAEFCFSQGLDSEGLKFLNRGITANAESCLLAFKLADRLELGSSNDDASDPGAKQRMQKVREPYDKVLDALYDLITKNKAREESEMRRVQTSLAESNEVSAVGPNALDEASYQLSDIEANAAAAQAEIDDLKRYWQAETELIRRTISYAWIALMRAARRIQGKGMPSEKSGGFRAIFQDARKKGKLTSEFYVESALTEYHCYNDSTVTKIFERGIKLFPEDQHFALEYLKHLIAKNDVTNARAVFETTVAKLTANEASVSKAKPLFIFFHDYESHYGDLTQIAKLEARMASLYPDDLGLRQFASRFKSSSFDPTAVTAVVSTQQTVRKQNLYTSIETTNYGGNSPATRIIESINNNSPKRPFPDDFEDSQPRKVARGESPLKGAAGRRMATQQRGAIGLPVAAMPPAHVGPPPLPNAVNYLLTIIPKASSYSDTRFDAVKIMELIRDIRLPPPIAIAAARHDQSQQAAPAWQPPQFQHGPPASLPPPGYMTPGANPPFGAPPFRYG